MENDRKFFKCLECGNIIGLIEDGGGTLACCGKDMMLLVPNTQEAATEKHIPVAKRENGNLSVEVGSVMHPMTEEHHISWIAVVQGKTTQRIALDKDSQPCAQFCIDDTPVTVYAYCNLHGLWVANIN